MKIEQSAATTGVSPTTIFGSSGATPYTAPLGAAKYQTNTLDTKATQICAEYRMGKFRPFAISGNSTNVLKSSGVRTFDAKSSMYGARYDLSKRTLA